VPYVQLFGRDDQVTVVNPLNKDYIFQWDGKRYLLRASSKQAMPGWMAEHYVKEMTNKLMQDEGLQNVLMVESKRQPYYDKLVISHSKMATIDSAGDAGDITVLGEDTPLSPNGAPKGGLKVADKDDPLIDEELNLDELPKDEDLYPDPKKSKKSAKPKAKPKDEDLEPGELSPDRAAEDAADEAAADSIEDEEAFPDATKN